MLHETVDENLCGCLPNLDIMAGSKSLQRGGLYCILFSERKLLRRIDRGVVDFSKGDNASEAVGYTFYGEEGKNAWGR